MPSNQQQSVMSCGCCGGTGCLTGCCLPIDHTNPLYEPAGTPKNIPFSISAPSCSEMDGYTGEMFCGGAIPVVEGPCGPCVSCRGEDDWLLGAYFYHVFPAPLYCVIDSCAISLCLAIICLDSNESDTSLEACCQKFALRVGSDKPLVGGIALSTGTCTNYIIIRPTSCVCSEDPDTFPAIIFDLAVEFECTDFITGTGTCGGETTCCDKFTLCDLTGAQVIV